MVTMKLKQLWNEGNNLLATNEDIRDFVYCYAGLTVFVSCLFSEIVYVLLYVYVWQTIGIWICMLFTLIPTYSSFRIWRVYEKALSKREELEIS